MVFYAPNTVITDAILSAPPVLVATHSYCPSFSDVNCWILRREPSVISVMINFFVLDLEITSWPFQRHFSAGGGVPLAMQSIDMSDPDKMFKLSPIWIATFAVPTMDSTDLFPGTICALLSPSKKFKNKMLIFKFHQDYHDHLRICCLLLFF